MGAGLSVLSAANRWPLALVDYSTATPLDSYLSQFLLMRGMAAAVAGFALLLAALGADVFLQRATGDRALRRPSLARAAAACLLLWGLGRASARIGDKIPGPRLSLPLWELTGTGTYSPALAALAEAFFYACIILCVLVAVVSAVGLLSPSRRWVLAGLAAGVYAAGRAQNVPQFAFTFAAAALGAGVVFFLVKTCGTDLLTLGLALFWLMSLGPALTLLEQPAPWLRWNGVVCVLVALSAGALRSGRYSST
jgi:hypothetical protein